MQVSGRQRSGQADCLLLARHHHCPVAAGVVNVMKDVQQKCGGVPPYAVFGGEAAAGSGATRWY
jgi:hypothetical protein